MASTSCPNCGAPLTSNPSLFGKGLAGLECDSCKTTFSDGAVTQQLFALAGIPMGDLKDAVVRGAGKPPPTPRSCPTCSKPLTRFTIKGIELDLCAECGTTAFDPGELWRLTAGKLGTAPAGPKQGVFEMLWDCASCDTKSLLGKTNRFCPVCGAPQDPKRRRFPEPGQEVAANTEFDGADKACAHCATPNGAKAVHCRHCGAPMDGTAQVKRVADQVNGQSVDAAPAAPVAAPPKKKQLWPYALGAVVVFCCGLGLVAKFWTKPSKATVSGHTWERSIDIEKFGPVSSSEWCDSMPSGAYDVSRSKKQRSTNKVPDGETCSTRNVDRGDGTFERKQECKPKYREEPVYADHCSFKIDKWAKSRSVTANGALSNPPAWPALTGLRGGSSVGSEREGAHHESYTVAFKGPAGESWSCDFAEGKWSGLRDGTTLDVKVRMVGGGLDCASVP
jgi:ribosomal protein L40E